MKPPRIAVVDYGVGNLMSIQKALEKVGAQPFITSKVEKALEGDAVVFPGVGAYRPAIDFLTPSLPQLKKAVEGGLPLLGICLGMELFFGESLEGGWSKGLGFLRGKVVPLPGGVKVPHMGWNTVKTVKKHGFLEGINDGDYFYFVHSYYAGGTEEAAVLATTQYGVVFPSVVVSGSLYGTQFHPEKSGAQGLRLLKNFVRLVLE